MSTKTIEACLFFNLSYKYCETHKVHVFTVEPDWTLSVSGSFAKVKNVICPNPSKP